MEINKPMTTRNMLASTLTDYKKPVKLPKVTVELDPMLKKRFKAEAVRRGTTIATCSRHGSNMTALPSTRRTQGPRRSKTEEGVDDDG